MHNHLLWVWCWFTLGCATYWLKRAYYLVTGPNPVASTYGQFLRRCWIPITVRWFLDSMVFWIMFQPGLADKALDYFGWTSYGWAIAIITEFAPLAAIFGHAIDSVADFAVSKIPFVKDILPQMPASVPAPPTPPVPGGDD